MPALSFIFNLLPNLLFGFPGQRPGGLMLSLLLSAFALAVGFLVALALGAARASRSLWLQRAGGLYVEVFRGLPLLLLLLLIHQFIGGRRFGLDFSPLTSTLIALTLYTSAYQTEIVRAGLMAVPPELVDSARLMGANRWQRFVFVRLRYALRVMLPAFTGQAISLFKDSSVVVVLGVGELMTVARAALGSDVHNSVYWVPIYLTVGALYAGVALAASRGAAVWERRSRLADHLTILQTRRKERFVMNPKRVVMSLLVLAVLAAACGAPATQTPAAQPAANESTLGKVQAAGVVRVGIRFDNPPLSYIDSNGNWIGFDVDLANEVAKRLGVTIEQVKVDETTRISFLQEGKIDMAVASMNHTRKRDDAVDFSLTYTSDNQTFMVRKDSEIAKLEDLFGKKVALNAGSSAIEAGQRYVAAAGGPEPEIVEFTDKVAAMQALRDGAVDGYAEDGITLLALAAGDPTLVLVPGGINPVQFGIGLPLNDSAWRDAVNYALQEMWKDGTYDQIYNKWLGPDADVHLPLGGRMEIWP